MGLGWFDLLLICLITALSAFPAVLFSLKIIFSSRRITHMLKQQIKFLPDILRSNSDARYAVKDAVEVAIKDVNTGLSNRISLNLSRGLADQVTKIVKPELESFEKSIRASITGQIGAAVTNITAQIGGNKDGPMNNMIENMIGTFIQKRLGVKAGVRSPLEAPQDLSQVPEISIDDLINMKGYG